MRRWCSWDSKAGPQDGRCRQNHGAMAATKKALFFVLILYNLHNYD